MHGSAFDAFFELRQMWAVGAGESYSQEAEAQGEIEARSVTCPRTTGLPPLPLTNSGNQKESFDLDTATWPHSEALHIFTMQDLNSRFCTRFSIKPARSTFYVVKAISAEFGMQAGDIQFDTQNEEWVSTRIRLTAQYDFLCVF
jgi:hypothetical protein